MPKPPSVSTHKNCLLYCLTFVIIFCSYTIIDDLQEEMKNRKESYKKSTRSRLLTQPGCDVCTRCSAHHNLLE